MKSPPMTSTQWKQLATVADLDSDGILHASVHFLELNSGEEFTVSISGRARADAGYWIGALTAALSVWQMAADVPLSPNATAVPAAKPN